MQVGIWILVGLFLFYILELFLHWHHCKDLNHKECAHKHHLENHKSGFLMFGGTLLHNAFHGVVLFGAFSVSTTF
jgi:zinc transporter ZupT